MLPKVSVVIGTNNRPNFLPRAIQTVLKQTFQDFEIIVVDDGFKIRADKIVSEFKDRRIRYISNNIKKGCAGSKNIGIRNGRGEYVAFLDDDDEWLYDKLRIQMEKFKNVPENVGYCFTALTGVYDDREANSTVPDGIGNYFERALAKFNGFLSSTLVIKRTVFDDVGLLSEEFPSHTDIDLVIRIAKKYKGIAINQPLIRLNLSQAYEHMASGYKKKIKGREMLLKKYEQEFNQRPKILAKHLFKLGIYYRNDGQCREAKKVLKNTWKVNFKYRYFFHYLSMFFNGKIYKLLKYESRNR